MLTHGNFHVRARRGGRRASRPVHRGRLDAPLPAAAHVFARIIQIGLHQVPHPAGPQRRHQNPLPTCRSSGRCSSSRSPACSRRSSTPPPSARQPTAAAGSSTWPPRPRSITHAAPTAADPPGRARQARPLQAATLLPRRARRQLHLCRLGRRTAGDKLGHFYRGIGLTVLEGYGLTETAALTVNLPEATKIGSVGRPLPGTAVAGRDDGELLFQGGQVSPATGRTRGTTEALERDGWFHTATSARSTTRVSCGSPAARRRSS